MYAHLLLFAKKNNDTEGPLFPNLNRSSSIHKNNPALFASIVLKKILLLRYLCAFQKIHLISRVLVRSLKEPNFTR